MLFRALLAIALTCVSLTGFARSNVVVTLALAERQAADPAVMVELTFTNVGRTPVRLLNWFVPDGEPEDDVFSVTRDGAPVSFMGPHIKRPAATADDFIVLQAGESITRSADIGAYYDLARSGDYTIQYQVSERLLVADSAPGLQSRRGFELETESLAQSDTLVSNEVGAFLAGRKNPFVEQALNTRADLTVQSAVGVSTVSFSGRCTATQSSTIMSAVAAASNYANGAVSYLNGTPSATQRYTTWFGTYSSANWNTIKGHYANIKDAFDNKPLTVDCSCKKTYYAYVYPTQPYKIYVCKAFWSAPLTGTDSKGGTLVHEMSHFNVVAGTDDWAYGQSAAKSLAISNPINARDNADSHEYFAENTPPLP